VHAQPTRGLTEDRDVVVVSAEALDVALHPPQRGLLVHQPVVARAATGLCAQRRVRQEAEIAQAVVDRHDDHALAHQPGGVVVVGLADGQTAAVDPHHHRTFLVVVVMTVVPVSLPAPVATVHLARREDVQIEAVFGGRREPERRGRLRTVVGERRGLARLGPPRGRLRWAPPQIAHRGSRVGDPQVLGQIRCLNAAHRPLVGAHHARPFPVRRSSR
jgi:hypothetical protein